MEISEDMIYYYLCYIVDEDIAEEVSDYYEYAKLIKHDAIASNDYEPLRLGLDYILCHPQFKLEGNWTSSARLEEDLRKIVQYIREVVYSNDRTLNCDDVKGIKLVPMSKFVWWKMRTQQGLHPVELLGPVLIQELKAEGWQPPLT